MASDYEAIRRENRERYGTVGAIKSGELAAGLYDDRAHFIFELLQNAEDALGRRGDWQGPRKVAFTLTPSRLTLSHFGQPFDEADVRSVCDIAESTKNEASIGRFGLGFKSVYTITNLPEIHSGAEDFAIEEFVFPKRAPPKARLPDETQIILPLRPTDGTAAKDITEGFRHLRPGALLFLRHIEEINWSVAGGASGFYLRNRPEALAPNVQRVTVIGQETGQAEVDQDWLVFRRDVFSKEQKKVGRVEIAFSMVAPKNESNRCAVEPLANSPLVVFFPTVVETHLGFLVQGPYRTTPSRENIPPGDPWNQHLVKKTAGLLLEAMRWMRDEKMLGVSALHCLPLDREKFPQDSRFAPLFDAVQQALRDEALIPVHGGGYASARRAKLARTRELRDLFCPEQIALLYGSESAAWLTGEITQDKAPKIRQYLMRELEIEEIRPERLLPSLTKEFLEAQSDDWVLRLYEFLSGQDRALRRRLDTVALIRLEDGTHVVAHKDGKPNAFLPGNIATGFPTMRRAVSATPEACDFLRSLGITEPDPVDDVIWNILPKYQKTEVDVDDDAYAADIERMRAAFGTDSATQKEKLRGALRKTSFVMVADAGDGNRYIAMPGDAYIDTARLQQLFSGVKNVLIVDTEYECLRGEDIRDLLTACGASRYLTPQAAPSGLGASERAQIRKESGLERASWEDEPEDFTLRGLTQLLDHLPFLDPSEAKARAEMLWEALTDLEGRGTAAFYGSYRWGYSHETKMARFDAKFVRELNVAAWVPGADGELVPPDIVLFDSLGWKPNPFLLTRIAFKPPIIDQLAKETGIDPAILDLLRRNPEAVAELIAQLALAKQNNHAQPTLDSEPGAGEPSGRDDFDSFEQPQGDSTTDQKPVTSDPAGGEGATDSSEHTGGQMVRSGTASPRDAERGKGEGAGVRKESDAKGGGVHGRQKLAHERELHFISYVGAHPDDEESDPDGLDQASRMRIEDRAIRLIISQEPALHRTPEGNPGFDLYEVDSRGKQVRLVEIKAMTGSLEDRPVGLSRTQFECAREHGAAYWLYIVEYATDPTNSRVLRIQDPFAHARTFTFDRGWSGIAKIDPPL